MLCLILSDRRGGAGENATGPELDAMLTNYLSRAPSFAALRPEEPEPVQSLLREASATRRAKDNNVRSIQPYLNFSRLRKHVTQQNWAAS